MTPTPIQRSILLSALLLIAFALPLAAQIPPLDDYGAGTRYVIAFPDTTTNIIDSRYPNNRFRDGWYLFLYSSVGNNRVRLLHGGDNSTTSLTLQAGKFLMQEIVSNPVVDRINGVRNNTVTITSEYPIVVYCFCAQRQGMEAWTPIPVDMWGTRYNAAAIPAENVGDIAISAPTTVAYRRRAAPSEILVIAAYDSTMVTIASPRRLEGRLGGKVEVRLNAGECYQVQSVADTAPTVAGALDLGGTVVSATRPIGVISGNTRALVHLDSQVITGNALKGMLMEWLAPVEELGTEFVYMPSWDSHRPGIGSPNARTREYARIYGVPNSRGIIDETFYHLRPGDTAKVNYSVRPDTLREIAFPATAAAYFKASQPMQAMMHSSSIAQLISSPPCNYGKNCLTYAMWAPYMVEMTPREQWPSFAPYYAPSGTASPMQHYINVVTDTLSMASIIDETGAPFPFTRKIPGTDLIWGSTTVSPGVDHYLYGKNGAKFSGFVYGFYTGSEQFRPASYAEYEEYNALSYGYPLAPLRRVLRGADSLVIDSSRSCSELSLSLRLVNGNPSGLRSVELDPASVVNARLVPVDPATLSDVVGRASASLKILPLNPLKDARATLVIKDRTGKLWRVEYAHQADRLDVDPDSVNFGLLAPGSFKDVVVTYTNPLDRDVAINGVAVGSGISAADGFEVTSTEPSGPTEKPARSIILKKGATFKVYLRLKAKTRNKLYDDSLKVILGCATIAIPVHGQTAAPLIMVNDIDFGSFIVGEPDRTRDLKVCNVGSGVVAFDNGGDDVLKWLDANGLFSIPPTELEELKRTTLGPGDCYTLHVTFRPSAVGAYRVTARFFASTRDGKDTSAWVAVVEGDLGIEEGERAGHAPIVVVPNPVDRQTTIDYLLAFAGRTTITIRDANGALVGTLYEGYQEAGTHRAVWSTGRVAAGVYYCTVTSGSWSITRAVMVVR